MSTLGYAILGLLAAQPRTGYDLARLMRTPIGYMWTAHHSQIYPELARLEGEGLVAATVIDGPGPRDTKRYEITPAGWHALQDWVDSPLSQVARSEFMLRIRGLWLLPPERARAFLLEQREWHESRLATFAMEEATFVLEGDAVDDPRLLSLPSTQPCAPASCTSRQRSPGWTGCSTGWNTIPVAPRWTHRSWPDAGILRDHVVRPSDAAGPAVGDS